jgi:succinyl-diaminopimelate desuccinylase
MTGTQSSVPVLTDVLELAQALIAIDTANPPGRERDAAVVVAAHLERRGVATELQDLGDGRANLVARVAGGGGRSLVLCGHLDTVPARREDWTTDPWIPEIRDGRLYGRGSCDMKGAVAMMAFVLAEVAAGPTPPGDVVLALTAAEETDSMGATALGATAALRDAGAVLIAEPTDMTIGIAHRGALWLEIEHDGRAAHGSQPHLGDNAVLKALEWLGDPEELRELLSTEPHPLLGVGSVSLNAFGGGGATNVVPDRARTVLDLRTIPADDHDAIVATLAARSPSARITRLRDGVALATPAGAGIVERCREALAAHGVDPVVRGLPYMTDASALLPLTDADVVVLGPGSERIPHQADEHLSVADLDRCTSVYLDLVRGEWPWADRPAAPSAQPIQP